MLIVMHMYRGLKPVEKRSGGGAHNWGNITDAVKYVFFSSNSTFSTV